MSSRARGVRGREMQWEPIETTWYALREKYPKLHFNDFIWILLDLGRWAWTELPGGIRQQMLSPHRVFTKREKQRMRAQAFIQREVEDFRIDDKLSLGLPSSIKATIRSEARTRKLRMSPYIRQRLGLKP